MFFNSVKKIDRLRSEINRLLMKRMFCNSIKEINKLIKTG